MSTKESLASVTAHAAADLPGPSGAEDTLVVDGGTTLRIAARDLVVTGEDPGRGGGRRGGEDEALTGAGPVAKRRRTCGLFPTGSTDSSVETIPLYNILWADLTPTTLAITHAKHLTPSKIRPTTLTFNLTPTPSPAAESSSSTSDYATAARAFADTLLRLSYGPAKPRRRAKVLVNPHAGPGGADRIWASEAAPIFEAARMSVSVVRTRHQGEGVDIAEAVDIDAFDTIVACSGDGLPHEIFNGLAKRPDARRALGKLAVAHIPCGSGNAMSCNLYGTHKAGPAALAIVKGVETPMDLMCVTQGERRYVSFLSQSLGIVAESDLATEHMRWMGGARFTVGFLARIFGGKVYPCDVAMKVEVEGAEGLREHYRRGKEDVLVGAEAKGEAEAEVEEGESSVDGREGLLELKWGSVKDKVPDGWEVVSYDKLGNFYCGNMSYMAPDANFFPASLPADGLADLVVVRGDLSPLSSVALMLSVEEGGLLGDPRVEYRKVSAFRVTPRDQESGYISVDGERVPFEPLQAEVVAGLGRVISKAGGYEAPGPKGWES